MGVEFRTERAGLIPVQAAWMAGPVPQLVKQRPVVVDLFEERCLRRNVNGIIRWQIESMSATDADVGKSSAGKGLRLRHDLPIGQSGRLNETVIRQVVALSDIEDGVAAQERYGRLFPVRLSIAGMAFPDLFAFWKKAVRIADRDAVLAFAH